MKQNLQKKTNKPQPYGFLSRLYYKLLFNLIITAFLFVAFLKTLSSILLEEKWQSLKDLRFWGLVLGISGMIAVAFYNI